MQSINSITKAMQMISTFRFKRAETRFSKIRSYLKELEGILANLSSSVKDLKHPLFAKRPVKKKALLVLTGDKGLCGAYNTNLLKAALAWKRQNASFETAFVPVGKVGTESLRKKGHALSFYVADKASVDFSKAKEITSQLKELFLSGQADEVSLLYTRFKAGGAGQTAIEPLLPLTHLMETDSKRPGVDYIYEPNFEAVFFDVLERYLDGKIYLAALESLTSETSARMMAMKQASDNGEEVLHDLKLLKNKTRQAVITRELSEIVAGASVLV